MKLINKQQLAALHALLNNTGMLADKKEIIHGFTDGRTQSSKELTFGEARELISRLAEHDPKSRQRALIFSLAYQAGIIYGTTADDKKMNAAKLNLFLKERGTVKKDLNSMSLPELLQTHRQFEGIVRNTQKSNASKAAGKAVKHLLDELNINTL